MMEFNSFIQVVKAYEVSEKYAKLISMLIGHGCGFSEEWDVGGKLYEVMRDNSIYAGKEDDKSEDTFGAIVNAFNISPEEKVYLLMGMDPCSGDDFRDWNLMATINVALRDTSNIYGRV